MPKQKAAKLTSPGGRDLTLKSEGDRPRAPVASERRNLAAREALLHRIRDEFEEKEGLSLTVAQAATLFGVSREAGERIFQGMFDAELLDVTADRHYVLRSH